jgi:4-hydroxybenzoate polyprenyltransferase
MYGFIPVPAFIGGMFSGTRPVANSRPGRFAAPRQYIVLLRPHQWVKNLFVLAPAFFGARAGVLAETYRPALAFVAFCAVASGVYIFNDIFDIEKDRIHERKRFRPLAAGTVSVRNAVILMLCLVFAAGAAAVSVGTEFIYYVGGYLLLNILYTLYFKHISLVDISFIAIGFVLRVLAGGVATDVGVSKWLILMTFLLACCLAVGKRRDDLLLDVDKESLRPAHRGYTLRFIDTCLVILGAVTIVCYVMYTVSDEVVRRLHTDQVYLTSGFVIVGILRFLQIAIVEEKSGSPTMILLRDTMVQAMVGLWFISFLLILYVA